MSAPAPSASPGTPGVGALPAGLRLGAVHLTVTDLDRSVAWHERVLGLRVHRHDVAEAALGAGGEDVVVLHEDAAARPAGRHAGLYHYALLFATREELARAAVRLRATGTPVQGASDHGTHEAIYLADPDGTGIELAADRPREQWPAPEEALIRGGPAPLDQGVPPVPEGVAGLRHWTVVLPTDADVAGVRARVDAAQIAATAVPGGFAVRDPWGIELRVVAPLTRT